MIDEQKAREAVFRIRRARMTGNTEHMSGTECDVLDAFITKAVASQKEHSGKNRAFVANLITERGRFEYALQALVPELYTQVRKAVYSRPYEENDHSAFAAFVRKLSPAAPEISPEFTDTSRAALCWVLWHHQGASSRIGAAMRFALGMGQDDDLREDQIRQAKWWRNLQGIPEGQGEPPKSVVSDGLAVIAAERKRQVEAEGWTPEHDDEHATGELANAAVCYALGRRTVWWPWSLDWWKPSPDNRIRELAKAGALIAAEIDRLQRAALGVK